MCHGVKHNAKYVPLIKQKLELFILGGQRIAEEKEGMVERDKREDWEREQREDRDRGKETKGNWVNNLKRRIRNIDTYTACCQLPQGTAFLLSSQLDSAVKRCSSEV